MTTNDNRNQRGVTSAVFDHPRYRRLAFVAVAAVVLASLVLGRIYGLAVQPYGTLLAFLFGGFVYLHGGTLLVDRDVFSVLITGVGAGLVGSLLVVGTLVSVTLGVSFTSVLLAILPRTLVDTAIVAVYAFVGIVAAIAAEEFRDRVVGADDDRLGVALTALGIALFAGSQPGTASLVPALEGLSFPGPLDGLAAAYAGNPFAAALGGVVTIVGITAFGSSRERAKILAAGLVVAGVLVGATAVGNLYGAIDYAYEAQEMGDQLGIEAVEAEVVDRQLRIALDVRNPTDEPLAVAGAHVERVSTDSNPRAAWGAARTATADGSGRLPPGETTRLVVEMPLTADQADALGAAIDGEGFVVHGEVQFAFAREQPGFLGGTQDDFGVAIECDVGAGSVECTKV